MGTGYIRNDTSNNIADGQIINASDLDGEFDAVLAAFSSATGHTHDGTSAEGAAVTVLGPAQEYVGAAGDFSPKTDSTYNLGKTGVRWAAGFLDDLDSTAATITTLTTELGNIVSTSDLPVTKGGTGGGTASAARTNLGLGTMAVEAAADYLELAGGTLTGPVLHLEIQETYTALSGTTPAVNLEVGTVFSLTTSGDTTFTFSNPVASGAASSFTLEITAGGTHTLTWPGSVDWAGGAAPAAPADTVLNIYTFYTRDGGTTWFGFLAGVGLA